MDDVEREDILNDALELFGGERLDESGVIMYGPLRLSVAEKVGGRWFCLLYFSELREWDVLTRLSSSKANTLLADQLFSPALLLAEQIETGKIDFHGGSVLELGAGAALPSLMAAMSPNTASCSPKRVVITDHPDPSILNNLHKSIDANRALLCADVDVEVVGYEWGANPEPILALSPDGRGFDALLLSDLLHFTSSHSALLWCITTFLAHVPSSRLYVAAGKYTKLADCQRFLREAESKGLAWTYVQGHEEVEGQELDAEVTWEGSMQVGKWTKEDLASRKAGCRFWIGQWGNLA